MHQTDVISGELCKTHIDTIIDDSKNFFLSKAFGSNTFFLPVHADSSKPPAVHADQKVPALQGIHTNHRVHVDQKGHSDQRVQTGHNPVHTDQFGYQSTHKDQIFHQHENQIYQSAHSNQLNNQPAHTEQIAYQTPVNFYANSLYVATNTDPHWDFYSKVRLIKISNWTYKVKYFLISKMDFCRFIEKDSKELKSSTFFVNETIV